MRGGAEHRNKNKREFRCSAPPLICSYFVVQLLFSLICSYFDVQLLLSFVEEELDNEIRANETKEELNI
jgi:hypothetical protein